MNEQTGEITDTPNKAPLYAKMARVMGKMSRIKKTGYNKAQSYQFATESDVVDMVREAMAEEGIAFFVDMIDMTPTPRGEKMVHWIGHFVFTFADTETGITRSCPWIAEAMEYGDKGINKVATAAVKYFLLKTFLISTGDKADDADNDAAPVEVKATPKRQPLPAAEIKAAAARLGTGTDGRRIPVEPKVIDMPEQSPNGTHPTPETPATGLPTPDQPTPSENSVSHWQYDYQSLMKHADVTALYPRGEHRANVLALLERAHGFEKLRDIKAAVKRVTRFHKLTNELKSSDEDAIAVILTEPEI